MKFAPRKARDDVNVSDTHPLEEAGILIVGMTALFAAVALILVFAIEIVLMFVSPEKEAQLFEPWSPVSVVDSEGEDSRTESTQALLDRLVQHWPDSPYSYQVSIDDSESPNAVAFPGGNIMVTTGLLDSVGSENELAFVLGHELGHFRNRDHIRGLGRGTVLAIVFAIITRSEGDASLGLSVADLTLRGFGREQETDADEFGLMLLNTEYGHVNGAPDFFRRLVDDEETSVFSEYLSTHPDTVDRLDELAGFASESGYATEGELTHWGIQEGATDLDTG